MNNLLSSLLLAGALASLALPGFSQQKFTISGKVTDADNGETLIGATVFAPALGEGASTNDYGFYALTLPGGDSVTLEFSYVGFQNQLRTVFLDKNLTLDVEMGSGVQLQEVVVKANSYREQIQSTEMSVEAISMRDVRAVPVLLGESDILKTLQLKPGIPSGAEGTTGFYVRGGGADQNLIVLDEALVYNANHLFGFFSTFNSDAVKDVKLYKGGFPAQYGGRLSSVIDVKLKEGNNKEFAGQGGIGLIASRLTLEGPIQKGKSSFMVSGRRTYFDLITAQVNKANEGRENYNPIPDYYFYDLNAKLNFELGPKDKLFLSGYFGRDVFGFNSDFFNFNFFWGNATGTARWNHVFGPRLFSNTTFTFSDYQYNIANQFGDFNFELGSNIQDVNLKTDFFYTPTNRHTVRFGVNTTYHQFVVGRLKAGSETGEVAFSAGQDFDGWEFGAYVSDEWKPSDRFALNAGLRLSGFANDGAFYTGLEPRLASVYHVSDLFSVKASYARMFQYLHLVSNSGVSLPTDVWYPSTSRVKPQRSDQVAAGVSFAVGDLFMVTNEYYYKWLDNQLDFIDGAELFLNNDLEGEFAIGKGYAYGMEIQLEKTTGRLTGWIGYTLARIRRGEFEPLRSDAIFGEGDAYFSPRYDRRHDISVVAVYEISRRWQVSATWVYGSGDLYWLPPGRFSFQDVQGSQFQALVPVYQNRNNYRLIPFHRLDLGVTYRFLPKWGESDLSINVINAYDRRNAFFVYLEPQFQEVDAGGTTIQIPESIAARQVSLFPILPSITYNFKF
jgi:hypothetical protein